MMFERMTARAGEAARRRARERKAELAERVAAELPPGIAVEQAEEGIALSGRDIRRRFALEPALRWLVGGLR